VQVGEYQAINIKLDKAAGLTQALALAEEAKRRGLRTMVGGVISKSLGSRRRCSSHSRPRSRRNWRFDRGAGVQYDPPARSGPVDGGPSASELVGPARPTPASRPFRSSAEPVGCSEADIHASAPGDLDGRLESSAAFPLGLAERAACALKYARLPEQCIPGLQHGIDDSPDSRRPYLDWGKNAGFFYHSPIYQTSDVRQIPYHNVRHAPGSAEDGAPITELQEGLSKPLHAVAERLNLLGFTRDYARRSFDSMADYGGTRFNTAGQFDFEFFAREFAELDVSIFDYELGRSTDFAEALASHLYERLNLERPTEPDPDGEFYIIQEAANCLSAYTVLQLLAEKNPAAAMLPVNWESTTSNMADGRPGTAS
jgi:hypothetical protein